MNDLRPSLASFEEGAGAELPPMHSFIISMPRDFLEHPLCSQVKKNLLHLFLRRHISL